MNWFLPRILSDNTDLLNDASDDESDCDSSLDPDDDQKDKVDKDEGSCNMGECDGEAAKTFNRIRKRRKIV